MSELRDTVHVKGLTELDAVLSTLTLKLQRNVMRGALRAGSKVQLQRARQLVPVKQGALRDSLRIRTSVRRGVVRSRLIAGNAKAFYAHMVEFGTAAHYIKPKTASSLFIAGLLRQGAQHPGASKHPFMRPALDATVADATRAIADYIRARLNKQGLDTPDAEGP